MARWLVALAVVVLLIFGIVRVAAALVTRPPHQHQPRSAKIVDRTSTSRSSRHTQHRRIKDRHTKPTIAKPHHHPSKASTKHHHGGPCPARSRVLSGVYHPERLIVLDACKHASGVVTDLREEEDGDLHVLVQLDHAFRALVNHENRVQQHGWLVVELTPRDHAHLPSPYIGQHIGLMGAWVLDTDHGWKELHPVWQEILDGHVYRSGPWAGGSPPYNRSTDALAGCRTARGRHCVGYGGVRAFSSDGDNEGGGGGKCTPGYSVCLTPASDYDCVGGGGDGPEYVQGTIKVTGSDPYNLDTDGDGKACEAS